MSPSKKTKVSERVESSTAVIKNMSRKSLVLILSGFVIVTLVIIVFFLNTGLKLYSTDIMKDATPNEVKTVKLSEKFIKSQADFSIDLFKKTIRRLHNISISPMSVYYSLAMLTNGADGYTLDQFEHILGKYGLTISDINKYCYSHKKMLQQSEFGKFSLVNSIWMSATGDLKVNKKFISKNADYYGIDSYISTFESPNTFLDVNNWLRYKTENKVSEPLEDIGNINIMLLVNSLVFENEWLINYGENNIKKENFTIANGDKIPTDIMYSTETMLLEDKKATGFIKQYKDTKYSFVAMLPKMGVSVEEYISTLSGNKFLSLINNKSIKEVFVGIPRFKIGYEINFNEPLEAIGITKCFKESLANFFNMETKEKDMLFVSNVIQKTFFRVDGLGTKVGDSSYVEIPNNQTGMRTIVLNRPFFYAVIDSGTGLPIYMGMISNPKKLETNN